jgi:predicted DsbA family dithiol-disulfide isomerase
MKIEIWSDVMCPFCYLGKKHLEEALEQNQEEVEIEWKSFQLNPQLAGPPVSTLDYLSNAKGMPVEQISASFGPLREAGRNVGIELNFEKAQIVNTRSAHRFIQWAKAQGKGDEAEEKLFYSHFTLGENVGDHSILNRISEELGLGDASDAQTNPLYDQAVDRDLLEASQIGVRGVPFFVFNNKYAVSGAQPAQVFKEVIEKLRAN